MKKVLILLGAILLGVSSVSLALKYNVTEAAFLSTQPSTSSLESNNPLAYKLEGADKAFILPANFKNSFVVINKKLYVFDLKLDDSAFRRQKVIIIPVNSTNKSNLEAYEITAMSQKFWDSLDLETQNKIKDSGCLLEKYDSTK